MARDFLKYPFQPYNGVVSSKPINDARGLPKGLMIALGIQWATYTVGLLPPGNKVPNFAVAFNLNVAGPNSVRGTWTIQSVYIDNEGVDFPVYVTAQDTGFTVSCPANSAGWYPFYTNSRAGLIAGLGITDAAIIANQQTKVFLTDVIMNPSLDEEIQTAVSLGLISPSIAFGGASGNVSTLTLNLSGSGYANGGLAITGGGGTGASGSGVVDSFGRFTSVSLNSGGAGYTGFPVVTPTGAQTSPQTWVASGAGAAGLRVTFNGLIYTLNTTTGNWGIVSPALNTSLWTNTGVLASQPASFQTTISSAVSGSVSLNSSAYGPIANGDQVVNYITPVAAATQFLGNMFGTPFASGFIYLKSIYVRQLTASAGGNTWTLQSVNGVALTLSSAVVGEVFAVHGANIKLPANVEWTLNCTSFGGSTFLSHGFAYTYSQN